MADNISTGVANSVLALILNGTAYTPGWTNTYVQLHIGAPGPAGTTNVAANSTRQAAGAFTVGATAGVATNAAAVTWPSVPASETYSHASLWSAATTGTFICSGSITASAISSGQSFQIAIGGLTVSLPVAS